MKRLILAAALAAAGILAGAPASAQGRAATCVVADPTGTPLNVRETPSGRILGAIERGARVRIGDLITDERGRDWAFIQPVGPGRRGWVFREYLFCD